jgi:hypothetical protein
MLLSTSPYALFVYASAGIEISTNSNSVANACRISTVALGASFTRFRKSTYGATLSAKSGDATAHHAECPSSTASPTSRSVSASHRARPRGFARLSRPSARPAPVAIAVVAVVVVRVVRVAALRVVVLRVVVVVVLDVDARAPIAVASDARVAIVLVGFARDRAADRVAHSRFGRDAVASRRIARGKERARRRSGVSRGRVRATTRESRARDAKGRRVDEARETRARGVDGATEDARTRRCR